MDTLSQKAESGPGELPATVYTPASPLRSPRVLFAEMAQGYWAGRGLAWRLFVRDLQARYRNSLLGYLWLFIPPLVAALPFVYLNSQGVVEMGTTTIPYAAYAMTGTIIWQVFVDALSAPLRAITGSTAMLTKINFPREALILTGLMQVGFGFLVRLTLLVAVMAWFRILPPATAVLFPVGILSLVMAGYATGLFLTPIGMLYGDVQQGIPVITTVLMLLTPVLYPVPESGMAAVVAKINPLTSLVATTRDWATLGQSSMLPSFLIFSGLAVVGMILGTVLYRVAVPHLIARLGN